MSSLHSTDKLSYPYFTLNPRSSPLPEYQIDIIEGIRSGYGLIRLLVLKNADSLIVNRAGVWYKHGQEIMAERTYTELIENEFRHDYWSLKELLRISHKISQVVKIEKDTGDELQIGFRS